MTSNNRGARRALLRYVEYRLTDWICAALGLPRVGYHR